MSVNAFAMLGTMFRSIQWGISTDVAIYRPSTGTWWILHSSADFTTYTTYQWGVKGDIPVVKWP